MQKLKIKSTFRSDPHSCFANPYPLLLVVLVTLFLMFPWIAWGLLEGHDQDAHLQYFHAFNQQVRGGELYPRWLSNINCGAGSPIFFVQYPLPYFVASALQYILRLPDTQRGELHALGMVFIFAALFLVVSLYLWCSRFVSQRNAALAAVAGLTLPYVLWFDFYTRAAIGECIALGCMPLALYFSHYLEENALFGMIGIGFTVGMLLLAHSFTMIMFAPFLLGYSISIARKENALRSSALTVAAIAFGMCLSAVYVLPVLSHGQHFDLSGLMRQQSGNFSYQNQLFPLNSQIVDKYLSGWWGLNWILRMASLATLGYILSCWRSLQRASLLSRILVLAASFFLLFMTVVPILDQQSLLSYTGHAADWVANGRAHLFGFVFLNFQFALVAFLDLRSSGDSRMRLFLFSGISVCFLLMTRWTAPLWNHAHFLWNLQFPWRFFGLLSIFFTGLLALWFQRLSEKPVKGRQHSIFMVSGLVFLSLLAMVGWHVPAKLLNRTPLRPERFIDVALPTYLHTSQVFGELPWPCDTAEFETRIIAGMGMISYHQLSSRKAIVAVECTTSCTIQLHLVYFPTWRAFADDGTALALLPSAETGLVRFSVPAGSHQIHLDLPYGLDESAGLWLSVVSLSLLCVLLPISLIQRAGSNRR